MFPRIPIPDSNLTSYLGAVVTAAKRQVPASSNNIDVRNSPIGSTAEIPYVIIPSIPNLYQGHYQDGYGYPLNAIVDVPDRKAYTDSDGNTFMSTPGVYICVSPVIAKVDPNDVARWLYLSNYYANNTQIDGVIYAPVYPYTSGILAHDTEDGKGKYWQFLCPAITEMYLCVNDERRTYYIAASEKSGSV